MRAILLSGRGRHFTAGLDLEYAVEPVPANQDPGRAAEARLRHIEWLQDAFSAVEAARPPVIAAIHGGCIGAGVDLASACDLRVASADAFFQVAEVDVAITADLGTLQRLGYLIPQGVVRELTYTGRRMGAEEAARYGLVNRVEADRDAASPPAWSWRGRSPPSRRSRSPAPRRASITAAAGPSRRACAMSPVERGRPWSAPISTEAVRARLGKKKIRAAGRD